VLFLQTELAHRLLLISAAEKIMKHFLVLVFGSLAIAQTVTTSNAILNYQPITGEGRVKWITMNTVGPATLAGGAISAGWGTLYNLPSEYGTHWEGFGKRYGMRLTGIATSNTMEAGLGAIWGEDPRYVRAEGQPFKQRLGNVVKMTFLAHNRQGRVVPAYARYAAIPGNNFLSNTWRADNEATVARASLRTLLGFLGRMSGNAFEEFWPDVKQRLFDRN
jgi:hypothetical protein